MARGFENPMHKQLNIYIVNRHRAKPGAHFPLVLKLSLKNSIVLNIHQR